jgi:hypothetical protein
MRKRHFLIYYDPRVRELIKTTPRTWAKCNQGHFPDYSFTTESHPKDNEIEKYILKHFPSPYFRETEQNLAPHKFKILYCFEPNIPPSTENGRNFIL